MFIAETTISANQDMAGIELLEQLKPPLFAVVLNIIAGCCAFVQIVVCTAAFSLLQFISFSDMLKTFLWKLIVSIIICRMVSLYKVASFADKGEWTMIK